LPCRNLIKWIQTPLFLASIGRKEPGIKQRIALNPFFVYSLPGFLYALPNASLKKRSIYIKERITFCCTGFLKTIGAGGKAKVMA
jgi:hypothetical protein